MIESLSIHPRCVKGRQVYEKRNTARPCKRSGRGILGWRMKRLGERRVAHANTLKSLPVVQQRGYKTPGSMRGF